MGQFQRPRVLWRSGAAGLLIALTELVLLAVVLVAFFVYQSAIGLRGDSRDAVEAVDNLLIALLDAETGERGYLITDDDEFLDPYRDGVSRINEQVEKVGSFIDCNEAPDSAGAYDRMVAVIEQKVQLLQNSVEIMANDQAEDARQGVIDGRGRELMDAIRTDLGMIRDDEERTLQSRVERVDDIGRFIAITSGTLAVLTMAVVAWLLSTLGRREEAAALRAVAEAKDEFVGFVSHELRTPIALVAGNVQMLEDAGFGAGDAVVTEALEEISYAAERQEDIVNTLLSLAKAGSGTELAVEPVLLSRIAESVRRRHLRQHPELRVQVSSHPDTPPALGDRSAIEQVLINLISNANKYGDHAEPIQIDVAPDGAHVRVSVTNAGSTVDREAFARVFEPFFRMPANAATAPGIGLGLTVCHRLIAAQGGHMNAEAVDSGGARFTFRLPVARMEYDLDV